MPQKGRWLTENPVGFYGGQLNVFAYVYNCPTSYYDSTGNAGVCCSVSCYVNKDGTDPTCLNRNVPFIGRGCAATKELARELANDMADDGLRRWDAKRGAACQFKHCHNTGCTKDSGQRGRRLAQGSVPAPVRWVANCSDAQLVGLCIVTAAGIVICAPALIPVIIKNRQKIPAQ